jgi:Mrp family chromosome partitioning ATPase
MSKNFELMQEVEQEVNFASRPRTVLPTLYKADHENEPRLESHQLAHEEIVKLVQQTFLLQTQKAPRMVLFAGLDQGSSCSHICLLVADALKRIDTGSVCLVEADFRSTSLTGLLRTTSHDGLADSLLKNGPIRSFAKPLDAERIWLLSRGSLNPDSPDLLNGERIKSRFAELRTEFEYVIVNAPSLSHYADATALGRLTDGLVLVLEANSTRKDKALKTMNKLRAAQIPVIGAVLNNRSFPIPEWLYHRL